MSYRALLNKQTKFLDEMSYTVGIFDSSLIERQAQPERKPAEFPGVTFAGDSNSLQAYSLRKSRARKNS